MTSASDLQVHDPFRLDGKVAVITGASSGMGARFAHVLAAAGATVALVARRADRLASVAGGIEGATFVTADLGLEDDRRRVIDEVLEQHGRIDVLVNNAGMSRPTAIESESLDLFRETIEVNLTALWHLTKLVGPSMVARGSGSVINIASTLGLVGATPIKQASYVASKGGVVSVTRELALQWARKGVRVNAICPGWFLTEMTEDMVGDERSEAFVAQSPIPRFGRVEELDGALLLLAGEAGSFITGANIVVDGGWTAR